MVRHGVLIGMLWCGGFAAVSAEELSSKDARSCVEQSARKSAEAFVRQNAKAPAALFTPESEWVSADFHRCAVIEAEYAASCAPAIN